MNDLTLGHCEYNTLSVIQKDQINKVKHLATSDVTDDAIPDRFIYYLKDEDDIVAFLTYDKIDGRNINRIFFDAIVSDLAICPSHSKFIVYFFVGLRSKFKGLGIRRVATHIKRLTWDKNIDVWKRFSYSSFLQETTDFITCVADVTMWKDKFESDAAKDVRDAILTACHCSKKGDITKSLCFLYELVVEFPYLASVIEFKTLDLYINDVRSGNADAWVTEPELWSKSGDGTPLS